MLICGRLFQGPRVAGLQVALTDLAAALGARGWDVDVATTPESLALTSLAGRDVFLPWSRPQRGLLRRVPLPSGRLSKGLRLVLDRDLVLAQSAWLRAVESRLRRERYDAVIACVSRGTPGLARTVTGAHPRVLVLSLDGLASELRHRRWLQLAHGAARVAAGAEVHPALYRAVDPDHLSMAVFASEAWRRDAVRAGLPAARARTIYFGIPRPAPLAPLPPASGRLLWVGRCSPEKGLHTFLDALAELGRTRAVTLTAICGQGPDEYRRSILARIERLGLGDGVQLRPPVPRAELGDIYRSHDVFLFHSVFGEPVALALMEAFGAGVPVVAPRPHAPGVLLQPDTTFVPIEGSRPGDVAAALGRALDDDVLRASVRTRAYDLVSSRFTLDAMGAAYDDALASLLQMRAPAAAGSATVT